MAKKSIEERQPLVSVVMATYNEEPRIIRESVKSILQQSYSNFELIIVDDSDNEETVRELIKLSEDSRVKLLQGGSKRGFIRSLNVGLEISKGKYIARMDGDDISFKERFEKQVSYLQNHKNVSLIGSQIIIIDEIGRELSVRKYPCKGIALWLYSTLRSPVAHPTVMFHRRIIDKGFRYNESLEKSEDLDLWLKIENEGYKIENTSDILLKYRVDERFIDKRVNDSREEKDTIKIRRMYATWKRPMFSFLSLFFSLIRVIIPSTIKAELYRKENKHY